MSVRVVRLGAPRAPGEGLRIGTVRRPPRGVAKADFARRDWYDVWLPELAPSADLVGRGRRARSDREWAAFARGYRSEMAAPAPAHLLDLLAALSRSSDFAVGCYCPDERRCHRSELGQLLAEHGAKLA